MQQQLADRKDTIFALSTPPGKSGVAVVRVSGPMAPKLLLSLTRLPSLPPPRQAVMAGIYHPSEEPIDRGLIIYFKGPNSFTGEDIVEFHVHGGTAIIQGLMAALSGHEGVRPAEPGEFMRRAFFNDKADLLEAEAIADMIDAETSAQLRQANKQMQGQHSKYYQQLRGEIVEILALLEAYIDFPEEDIPESVLAKVSSDIESLKEKIARSLSDNMAGERIRSGFRISIIGAPNVGKSTLLNALAGRDAAIVSRHEGTTRDVIELSLDIGGYPAILCDTAGIRESSDEVEQMGIARSRQNLNISDIALLVVDAARPETLDSALAMVGGVALGDAPVPSILIINKCDAVADDAMAALVGLAQKKGHAGLVVNISAMSDIGLDDLRAGIFGLLESLVPEENVWVTRARHREQLEIAHRHLSADLAALPLELQCEEIRLAAVSIGKITGKIITDELLDVIFSRFCIGK